MPVIRKEANLPLEEAESKEKNIYEKNKKYLGQKRKANIFHLYITTHLYIDFCINKL